MLKDIMPGNGADYGYSVGISGDTAIVAALFEATSQPVSWAAYIFERNFSPSGPLANNWGLVKMLKASSPGNGDNFGFSVGISSDTAIVGAFLEDTTQS